MNIEEKLKYSKRSLSAFFRKVRKFAALVRPVIYEDAIEASILELRALAEELKSCWKSKPV